MRAAGGIRFGYTNLDVKICATHAGLTVGEDGATHQCLEDMAIMRSIPNIRVVCPADCASTRLAIKAAIDNHGPFYIRLWPVKVPAIYGDDMEFVLGRPISFATAKTSQSLPAELWWVPHSRLVIS